MTGKDRIPPEEKAVEGADDLLAGAGEPPARTAAEGPGNADLQVPGVLPGEAAR